MSLVSILGTTLLYNVALIHTLALQRVQSAQSYHATHALLSYGIAQCKELDIIRERIRSDQKSKPEETIYTFDHWLPARLGYTGVVRIIAQNDTYTIATQVFKQPSGHAIAGGCVVQKGVKKWELTHFVI